MRPWKQVLNSKSVSMALLAAVLAGLLPTTVVPAAIAQRPAPAVAQTNGAIAQELLRLVNVERQRVNAPPLVLNEQLTAAAQRHAQDMATSRRMSHTGSDGSTMRSRIDATQYSWSTIGENVAMGQPTAAAVMNAWMNSPGHRQNILNPAFRELGVGHATGGNRPYWVQVFARPR
ncbi:CAP domain-containing protein [Nodosilinea sp. PGN35]|uniref:CAP domain-containing protein n=1 Tax=Nodosilinea sp. PGN35 TaxID=3020489 RepID=UPI0023B2E980|nr:CAP domain-containing protein [Nodosilinea sp. TSF1-S3]MDF0368696.1 CAP domain-containing protein [Nodosilinea sp. TSF1-S3]